MGKIYNGFSDLVGNTPLVSFSRLQKLNGSSVRILAKIEYLNPAGSIKDRTAWGLFVMPNAEVKSSRAIFWLT